MKPLEFPAEIADIEIRYHSVELEEAVAREVARLRIIDALRSIVSLRYVHSKSRLERTLSALQKKEIASSFALFGLDAKAFSELTECHVRRLGTTRPNDWLLYARNRSVLPREWGVAKDGVEPVLKEVKRLQKLHGDNYDAASADMAGWFRASKATESFAHRRFRYIDNRGAYKEDDPTAPGGRKFELINPRTGKVIPLRANRGWAFDQEKFNQLVDEGRISFVTENSIMVRRYLHETDYVTPQSVFYQPTRSASERLLNILGRSDFDFPKDETILQKLIEMSTDKDSLVLDSFAGSGTTGHAVLKQNAEDGGNRRFILVEMDQNIAQTVTRERVKRVAEGYTNAKGQTVDGLGGGFQFCRLSADPLFDADGQIRSDVKFAQLAEFVWFAETGTGFTGTADSALLGVHEGRAVYLLYNGILKDKSVGGGNVLTEPVFDVLPKFAGPKVIYAAANRMGGRAAREGITFKQTPYALEV